MLEHEQFGNQEIKAIFLPGGGVDIRCYKPLLKEIAKNFSIVAVNLPGLGKSSKTENVGQTLEALNTFVDSLDKEKLTIIGHSFGGAIAEWLSQRNSKIEKVVLINPSVIKSADTDLQAASKLITKAVNGSIRYPNLFAFNFKTTLFLIKGIATNFDGTISHLRQSSNNVMNPVPLESKSRVERLILWGKDDEFTPLKNIPKGLLNQIVLVDGNHDWLMSNPTLAAKKIVEFINA